MEKVLITGISCGQGRLLARRLADKFEVCGVDRVPWKGHPEGIRVHVVDLTRKKFEDVIRTEMPLHIVHMGFIRHFRSDDRTRYDVNVRGTRKLLDHCVHHGVQSLVVLSSGYVYGAFPENPYYLDEEAPLSASRSYPEIRDLVEVDTLATTFLWRYPHIRTCVLRPVNVLGYYVHSMIGQYLRERRVPTVMGFDPMMQFIHEEDLAEALALTVEQWPGQRLGERPRRPSGLLDRHVERHLSRTGHVEDALEAVVERQGDGFRDVLLVDELHHRVEAHHGDLARQA